MRDVIEAHIEASEIEDTLVFHEVLNPHLWKDDDLRLDIRVTLLKAALAFVEFLDLPDIKVEDVIFTGSNAAYNYTDFSDLDVHVIVNYQKIICPTIAENFFSTKKTLWNETHDISVRNYPVEFYVEDTANPVTANGVYSLLKGKWIRVPTPDEPVFNDSAVLSKVEQYANEIDDVLKDEHPLQSRVEALRDRIHRMRKAGLAKAGEFSVENLAFKALRNLGYMDRLYNASTEATDRELSLESMGSNPSVT
jgi:predicted nucleotidyltransferase